MSQVSSKLRKVEDGYAHWCPACEEIHVLPQYDSRWSFDGNVGRPSFHPSFKHEGLQRVFVNGEWTGEWKRDGSGNTIPFICHYNLVKGELQFANDCTHAFVGKTVALPDLPEGLKD